MAVQIDGMNQLLQRIQQMGQTIESNVKEKALREGAEIFKEKSKAIAPVRTGKLRDQIILSDIDETGVIHVGPAQQGPAFYAHFLELGTSKSFPRPFLGPAYENNKQAVQNKMAEVVRRELGL